MARETAQRNFKAALARNGLTQKQLALMAELSCACLSRIVTGRRRARASERARIELILGRDVAALLRGRTARRPRRTRCQP